VASFFDGCPGGLSGFDIDQPLGSVPGRHGSISAVTASSARAAVASMNESHALRPKAVGFLARPPVDAPRDLRIA